MSTPSLAELMEARLDLRKSAKSGNPAKRSVALTRLAAVEQMIADTKQAESKS